MSPSVKNILEWVSSRPHDDQHELSELAREIKARRSGVYRLNENEQLVLGSARCGLFATDDEIKAFWKRRGLP